MKVPKKFVLLLALGLMPLSGYCGTLSGTIQSILYYNATANFAWIYLNGTTDPATKPACTQYPTRMAIDISTPAGKALLAHLVALKLSSPSTAVMLGGTGTCDPIYNSTEVASLVFL